LRRRVHARREPRQGHVGKEPDAAAGRWRAWRNRAPRRQDCQLRVRDRGEETALCRRRRNRRGARRGHAECGHRSARRARRRRAGAMSDIALKGLPTVAASRRLIGAMIAALAILCAFLLSAVVPGGLSYPDWAIIPIAEWTGAVFLWIKNNFTWLTRGLTAVIDVPLRISMALLAKGYKLAVGDASYVLPRLSWLGICATAALIGHALGGM